jgi:hypothetical protein
VKEIYGENIFYEIFRVILSCVWKYEKISDEVQNENPDIYWKCLDDDDR